MVEERERLKRILHGCAEPGVTAGTDPWPEIRDRASGERTGEDLTARAAPTGTRRQARTLPNAPLALALAVLSVMILAAVLYVAAGPLHGPEKGAWQNRGAGPDGGLPDLRTEVDQTKVADGMRVILDWAYADERFVAVGLHVQRLEGARKPGDSGAGSGPAALWDDTVTLCRTPPRFGSGKPALRTCPASSS